LIDRATPRPYHPNVQPVISADQMREIDRLTVQNSETTSLQLMQAAAHACFQPIDSHFPGELDGKKALILCGPGNNGGDGAALAQELSRAGVHADIVLFGNVESTRSDARTNFEIVRKLANAKAAGSSDDSGSLSFVQCDGISTWEALAQKRLRHHR